ncbi:hypothetical protein [Actinokineospora globicatena]|uniref:hypothetical protein n=1 Tax=Actinokineospora globicatena TaxID=103729 RepID=UPI00255313B6|nr:hypothetical protein [Actinokineospora globicatena]
MSDIDRIASYYFDQPQLRNAFSQLLDARDSAPASAACPTPQNWSVLVDEASPRGG